MKTYYGTPPGQISVMAIADGQTTAEAAPRDLPSPDGRAFSWGTRTHETAASALAILTDLIGAKRALALHRRFMYRALVDRMKPDQPFELTEDEILRVVEAIEEVAEGIPAERSSVDVQPAPMLIEQAIGPGGTRMEWDADKTNTIKVNPPLKSKEVK